MSKIHLLSKDIIAKIAAGQVVERPSFAVKELIENSIDAQANMIEIKIQNSGLKKIVVTDNGIGMNKEDLEMCYEKHTTSKISSIDDLHTIVSMGFRGEALSSIAAISDMTISSKQKGAVVGNMVVLHNGIIEKSCHIGMPYGTHVSIENLFSNVPARQKFLKSELTELRYITDVVTRCALAYPNIRYIYSHNGNNIFDLQREETGLSRIASLLGDSVCDHLIPISFKDNYFTITGFVVHPQFSTENSNKQYLFVNKRPVRSKDIARVIKESYGSLLNSISHPIFILFIELPYDMVDVNVHPRKEEISLYNEEALFKKIKETITSALQKSNLAFFDKRWQGAHEDNSTTWQVRDGSTATYAAELLRNKVLPVHKQDITEEVYQLHNTYLLIQNDEGIMLVDQHAAHERILYEQFKAAFENEKQRAVQYILPHPILIDFSVEEAHIINDANSLLLNMGITIEPLGIVTYKVSTVPLLFKDRNIEELIREMVDDISQSHNIKSVDIRSESMISYLACRSAVKAGDVLTKEQARDIINKLGTTANQYTCPHGRPTQYKIPLAQIEKMFKRR